MNNTAPDRCLLEATKEVPDLGSENSEARQDGGDDCSAGGFQRIADTDLLRRIELFWTNGVSSVKGCFCFCIRGVVL